MTVAELWEEYRPKIAAAREADRREVQLSLVASPERIGRAWIMPMTLSRLLYLEAIGHPFLTGGAVSRDQVLDFLWIMAREFEPGNQRAAKRFFRRFWFRKINPEPLVEYLASEFDQEGKEDKHPESNWVAQLVDCFGAEYGWAEAAIMDIPLKRLFRYAEAICARKDAKSVSFNSPKADQMRHEYMMRANEIQREEAAVTH